MKPDTCTPLQVVRTQIDQACRRAGRNARTVRLIAVSKSFPAARVKDLLAGGQELFEPVDELAAEHRPEDTAVDEEIP